MPNQIILIQPTVNFPPLIPDKYRNGVYNEKIIYSWQRYVWRDYTNNIFDYRANCLRWWRTSTLSSNQTFSDSSQGIKIIKQKEYITQINISMFQRLKIWHLYIQKFDYVLDLQQDVIKNICNLGIFDIKNVSEFVLTLLVMFLLRNN